MRNKSLLYLIIIAFLSVASWMATAEAFDTYSSDGATGNCADCHGNFLNATYTSLAAAKAGSPSWPNGLHNTHRNTMLNGNCNACHSAGSRSPVLLFSSVGPAPFNQSCTGCHAVAGLRSHHANKGVGICADCHGGGSGGRENTLPLVYTAALGTTSGTTRVNNPCSPTAGGFEGQFADGASIGLDNDGDGLYDLNDPDCAPPAAPQIAATPASLSFGAVTVGAAASQNVTVSNSGNATLNVTPARCAGTSTEYTFSPAAAFTVPAAGSAVLSVTYTPSAAGADTGCIALTHNASNAASPLNVNVSGTGQVLQPVLSVSPTTASFGNVAVGSTANQTINVSNTGTATLTGSVSIPTGAPFTVSPASFSIPSGGAAVSLTVTFAPIAVGGFSATLGVTSNGGNQNVSLSGNGVPVPPAPQPVITVSPLSVVFPNTQSGSTATATVAVTNTGTATLNVTSINVTPGAATPANTFTVTPSSFSIPQGGAPVNLTVSFKPTATGAFTANMAVASNDPVTPTVGVGLSGNGVPVPPVPQPVISVVPTTLDFGGVQTGNTATLTVAVSNTGNATLTGSVSVPSGTPFSVTPTSFSIPSGGAAVNLAVTYAPTATGPHSTTMTVISNASNASTVGVALSGNGTAPPSQAAAIQLNPASLNFGAVTVGGSATLTTEIKNTGTAMLEVDVINLCGGTSPEFSWSPVLPPTIAVDPGAKEVLSVTYTPTASGADTGCLAVVSNDPAQPTVKLGVAGSGAAPQTNGVDIDIEEFKVKSKIDICPAPREANPVRISLEAENDGRVGGCSSATVVGMQSDVKVYDKTIELCLPAKGEGAFSFPGFKPTKTGTIVWTVTVKDGYPDADTAKTTTRVVCRPREEGGDASRR